MKDNKVQKIPGYSWVDVNNSSHLFVAADKSHPDSEDIYMSLKSLLQELREEGYVPRPELCHPMHPDNSTQVSFNSSGFIIFFGFVVHLHSLFSIIKILVLSAVLLFCQL
jgi:hypothetical protein